MRPVYGILLAVLLAASAASCGGGGGRLRQDEPARVVTHKVVPGESWEQISWDFYGSASRAEAIARYNGVDPSRAPAAGTGIRVPLSADDLDRLDSRLDAAAEYNSGIELAAAGDYSGAVEKFRTALREDPDFPEASFNLAVTYQKLGLHSNAETVLEDLVRREPGRAGYYFALGNARFYQEKYGDAAKAFRKALEADPGHLESLYSLAVTLEKTGKDAEAAGMWRRYLELDPDSEWGGRARSRLEALERKNEQR